MTRQIKYLFLSLTLCFCHLIVFAQTNTDSLWRLYNNKTLPDTIRLQAINDIAWSYLNANPDTAIILAEQLLQLAKDEKQKKYEAKAYRIIGVSFDNKSDYAKALDYHLRSLKISEERGNKQSIANSLNNIGNVYKNLSNYPKSLDYCLRSLKLMEEIGNKPGIANSFSNIGNIYFSLSDYQKSLDYHLRCLKISEEIKDKQAIVYSLNNIGNVYDALSDYSRSLNYYLKSLKTEEEMGDKQSIAISLGNIGIVYSDLSDEPKALDYFFRSLKLREELGDKQGISNSLGGIGEVYLKQKQYALALQYLLKALQLAKVIGDLNSEKEIQNDLHEAYKATGNTAKTLEHYERFVLLKDSIFKEENQKQIMRKEMNYEFEKKATTAKTEQDKKDIITSEEKRKQKIITYSVSGGLFLVLLLALFIFRGYRQKQKANKELAEKNFVIEEQKKIVEEKNKDITDSINYAQRIQRALLASEGLLNKNLGEYFVFFKPKDIVSGDFYWATEKDGRFYLAVCDSTGHGVPGAFISLLNISFLNEAIAEKGIKQPNEVFNHVRQRLIENISTDGAKDGMDGILVCFDRNNKSVSYAGANNAPYLMNGSFLELDTDNMPVGLGEKKDSFTHNTISFQSGNILYLYTDGFADQFGGPKGKKFKYKPLNEKLLAISHQPLAKQKEELEKTFTDWKGSLEQVDDVLVIGVKL